MEAARVGHLEVRRIEEFLGPAFPPAVLFPDLPADATDRHKDWLVPRFYDPAQASSWSAFIRG